jgi:hypothetical protein
LPRYASVMTTSWQSQDAVRRTERSIRSGLGRTVLAAAVFGAAYGVALVFATEGRFSMVPASAP